MKVKSLILAAATATLLGAPLSVALTAPAFAEATQDDKVATSAGDLIIHPVHHAAIVFTWNGKRVVVDPAPYPPGPTSDAADFKGAAPLCAAPSSAGQRFGNWPLNIQAAIIAQYSRSRCIALRRIRRYRGQRRDFGLPGKGPLTPPFTWPSLSRVFSRRRSARSARDAFSDAKARRWQVRHAR